MKIQIFTIHIYYIFMINIDNFEIFLSMWWRLQVETSSGDLVEYPKSYILKMSLIFC